LAKHTENIVTLDIGIFDYQCENELLCDYVEYQTKKAKINDFPIWLVDTSVNEEKQCIVFDSTSKKE